MLSWKTSLLITTRSPGLTFSLNLQKRTPATKNARLINDLSDALRLPGEQFAAKHKERVMSFTKFLLFMFVRSNAPNTTFEVVAFVKLLKVILRALFAAKGWEFGSPQSGHKRHGLRIPNLS